MLLLTATLPHRITRNRNSPVSSFCYEQTNQWFKAIKQVIFAHVIFEFCYSPVSQKQSRTVHKIFGRDEPLDQNESLMRRLYAVEVNFLARTNDLSGPRWPVPNGIIAGSLKGAFFPAKTKGEKTRLWITGFNLIIIIRTCWFDGHSLKKMNSLLVNICWLLSLQKCWASGVTTVCVEKLELNISVDLLSMKLLSFCKGKRPETKTPRRIWGWGGSHPNHRATLHISYSWAIALICICLTERTELIIK